MQKPRAIVWVDETGSKEEAKKNLVTNLSEKDEMSDLIYKDPATLTAVTTHKNEEKNKTLKSAIKKYNIDNNQLTGLKNFTEICKDPLALPPYALPESGTA